MDVGVSELSSRYTDADVVDAMQDPARMAFSAKFFRAEVFEDYLDWSTEVCA